MIEVTRIGENSIHGNTFEVNRPNGHPVYLLLLVKTPARFLVNGVWQETGPDTAVLYRPGQSHHYGARTETYQNSWMHIRSLSLLPPEHFPAGVPIALRNPEDCCSLFHLIFKEYYCVSPHRDMIISHLTYALFERIAEESSTEAYPDIYYALARLRRQIYQFPSKEWSAAAMASSLHISAGYLHSLYRHYFDTTCMRDVIQSRIQFSCELLSSGTEPVPDIAEACGYHSTEHFIRQFRSVMGTTPGKYRASISARGRKRPLPPESPPLFWTPD